MRITHAPSHRPPRGKTLTTLFGGTSLLLMLLKAAFADPPAPHFAGRWTPYQQWGATEVHMVLMPGTGGNHSQVLWWQHGHDHFKFGGLWDWNPSDNDCTTFPSSFAEATVDSPEVNIFCAGHAHIADGRLLVVGGTEAGTENGIVTTRLYDPESRTWSDAPDMVERRWYPSVTELGDGRMFISSGSQYAPFHAFGGLTPVNSTYPTDDTLYRYATLKAGGHWDPAVPRPTNGDPWPPAMEGHSIADMPGQNYVFGGRNTSGSFLNDVWRLAQQPNEFGPDYHYDFRKLTPIDVSAEGTPPPARAEHTAIGIFGGDPLGTMIVFGGHADNGSTLSDVWRLYHTQSPAKFYWDKINPSAPNGSPGALEGHAAVYDAPNERMLLFGGRSSSTGSPSSTSVWALKFSNNFADAEWEELAPDSTPPAARYDHIMSWGQDLGVHGRRDGYDYVVLFGGRDANGGLLGDVWTLWINKSTGGLEWKQDATTGPAPAARAAHAGWVYGGGLQMFVFGGETSAGVVDKTMYQLNLSAYGTASQWVTMGEQPSPRKNHVGMFYNNGVRYARQPELYTPGDIVGTGTMNTVDTYKLQWWFPQTFQVPGGNLFVAGPDEKSYLIDPDDPEWLPYPATVNSGFVGGTAVQYLPGHILKCGTRGQEGRFLTAAPTTKTIDLNPGQSDTLWKWSRDMAQGRVNHNVVALPTGELLAVGGTGTVNDDVLIDPVYNPELWRPVSVATDTFGVWYGGWGELTPSPIKRDYHSTALLLPDGRVLVGGGNADENGQETVQRRQVDIFCPPYLFRTDGTLATRPTITSSPPAVSYDADFKVVSPDAGDIYRVCLIKAGATTHGYDQDQRYVMLDFSATDDTLFVTSPASPDSAPPGDYLLFILTVHPDDSSQGVPSIASWIRVTSDVIPPAARTVVADLSSLHSVIIEWAAPGDDSLTGTAKEYDLRWSTSPITESSWGGATQVSGEPVPLSPGTGQGYQVNNLQSCTHYYFALKTRDEVYNLSAVGDTVSAWTICSGGGGGGLAAREMQSGGEAGSAAEATPEGPSRRTAGHTHVSPTRSGSHYLVAEFDAVSSPARLTVSRAAELPSGLDSETTSGVILQVLDGGGQWITRGHFVPGPMDDLVGLRPSEDRFRYVALGGYELAHVAMTSAGAGGTRQVNSAEHSRLGNVLESLDADSVLALADGEALEIRYAAASASGDDRDWLAIFGRNGARASLTAGRGTPAVSSLVPLQFALWQNQPNPFRGTTTIRFDLPVATHVKLEVFDLLGRRIRTLTDATYPPGYQSIEWDQRDGRGNQLRAGVFMYRLRAGAFQSQRKMVLLP